MAYSPITGAAVSAGTTGASLTTSAINTTGADIIFAYIMDDDRFAADTFGDSKFNTWLPLTKKNSSDFATGLIYYCQGPTVGSGHTFSLTSIANIGGISVVAFSGSTTSPFDVENGATNPFDTPSTLSPGSVTPGVNNEVIITGFSHSDNSTPAIDLGFTVASEDHATTFACTAIAYLIQTSAAAVAPTWDTGALHQRGEASTIATFKSGSVTPTSSLDFRSPKDRPEIYNYLPDIIHVRGRYRRLNRWV